MELIRARRVTLQICLLYKPEKSVILLSANLGLERRWIRGKTRDYLLHRLFITQSSTKQIHETNVFFTLCFVFPKRQ